MALDIQETFVQSYGNVLLMQAEQKGSRLYNTVMRESGIKGKSHTFETIGSVAAQEMLTRHGTTPLNPAEYQKRWCYLRDFNTAELVDTTDKLKMLVDPTSAIVMRQAAALGRKIDDEIIRAAFETSITGENAGGTEAWSGQTVAVNSWAYGTGSGDAGLTVSKLIEAKIMLDEAEAIDEQRYIVTSAKQVGNLLATTEATSADYNTVKALVNGEINQFMNFNFIRSERLPVDGSSHRRVLAYTQSGIGLAEASGITARVSERDDLNYTTQAYAQLSMGACRVELAKVVEILCDE
jgi:hypothetical protein